MIINNPNPVNGTPTFRWIGPNNFSQTTTTDELQIPNTTTDMSGYYSLVLTSGNNTDTIFSDSLVIVPTPQLNFSISDGTQFCEGDSVNLTVELTNYEYGQFSVNGGTMNAVPTAEIDIPTFAIHSDTTFSVYIQVSSGSAECYNTQSVTFQCAQTSSELIEDQICVGESYNNHGFTLPIQNFPKDTLLQQTFPNEAGCDSTAQLLLHVTSNPIITFVQKTPENCVMPNGDGRQDGSLVVSVTEGTGELQYTWTPAPAFLVPDSLLNIKAGSYTLTVVDSLGCQSTQTFEVEAKPNPVACFTITPESPSYLVGENLVFNNCSQYQDLNHWNMGDGHTTDAVGVTYVYNEIGEYTVTLAVEDAAGCTDSYEKVVEVHEKMRFYLPNSFTPDGDGVNDLFLPVQMEVKEGSYTIIIYDRWGNIVFTTKNLTEGWDGTVGGKLAEKGSMFTYFATYKDYDDVLYEKRGTITVLY